MVTVDTSELRQLQADLARTAGTIGALAAAALKKTAHDIEGDAKTLAPVDTGALQGSISTTITGDGRHGSMAAEIGPTVNYGAHVEYGTSRMAPQPYLGPAFDRRAPGLEDALSHLSEDIL